MARLLLSLLGYRFDVELCREQDLPDPDDEDEPDRRGSITTYRVGCTQPPGTPYDVDFPDRA